MRYGVETDELPREIANELRRLIESSGILSLQQKDLLRGPRPPDVFHYKLAVGDALTSQPLEFNDVTAPPTLHPLLACLRKRALEKKRKR